MPDLWGKKKKTTKISQTKPNPKHQKPSETNPKTPNPKRSVNQGQNTDLKTDVHQQSLLKLTLEIYTLTCLDP